MPNVARRKKTIAIDGASFIIAPLSYREVERYTSDMLDYAKGNIEKDSLEAHRKRQAMVFYVIACGLNNAEDAITAARHQLKHGLMTQEDYDAKIKPLELTPEDLHLEIDDELAAKVFREITLFTGLKFTKSEDKADSEPGESQAGS